ncbi:phosphatase PAP2 family protein [Pararhizobium antarcticum]|uniref:Phosphatidic acid phosphatase n=1 Tax=Pararhizobium antarcticum TaxID=1798805 RepID=A0A657LMM3_9HYPH|nr:phosphatase PAP2 family protein [Pararhizobium antarcticum]OJF91227.1 phosphatidic acid phosphatase [Pararhizobium antarcticum]OJG01134.1 phosphatidic acid phosphatase [Rhizobium sp. 58]
MNRPLSSSAWLLLAIAVLVVALLPFDGTISQRAQALPPAIVAFNNRITDFGTFAWMIYGAGSVVIIAYITGRVASSNSFSSRSKRAFRLALYFLVTIGSASALVHLAKLIIGRARPELFADYGAHSLSWLAGHEWVYQSFPSGHAAAVGSFFGAFSMLVPRLRILFLLGALTIGVTRVVVGAHYPSDVAAGLLLGLWTAIMTAFLFAARNWLFQRDEKGWPRPDSSAERNAQGDS